MHRVPLKERVDRKRSKIKRDWGLACGAAAGGAEAPLPPSAAFAFALLAVINKLCIWTKTIAGPLKHTIPVHCGLTGDVGPSKLSCDNGLHPVYSDLTGDVALGSSGVTRGLS